MKPNRKVILYIASSLDGYIAKPNDDLKKDRVWICYFYKPLIYVDSNLTPLGFYVEP